MKITYIKKNVFGNELMYVEGEASLFVNALTGKKTVTLADLRNLKALGLEVEYKKT